MPLPVHKNTAGLPFLFSAANLCLLLIMSGCSMVMATHGHSEPNFDNIYTDRTPEEVGTELGKPAATRHLDGGEQ